MMVMQVVVVLVYAPLVFVQWEVLDMMVLAHGQWMVMGRVAPLVLVQRESVSIAPSFLAQYDYILIVYWIVMKNKSFE